MVGLVAVHVVTVVVAVEARVRGCIELVDTRSSNNWSKGSSSSRNDSRSSSCGSNLKSCSIVHEGSAMTGNNNINNRR